MGFTMAEKILARASGRETVRAGEEVQARPDFVLAYEFPGYTDQFFKMMAEDFGRNALDAPERFAIFIDHMVPSSTPAEEQVHQATRDWCAKTGATLYERRGIGHQVCVEEGYAAPGAFVVHYDGHVSQIGAYGALGVNLPRRTLIEAFVRSGVDIKVPETVRVDLTGHLKPGVMGRDVIHHLIRRLGVKTCRFAVLELGGPAVATLSNDALQSIAGQVMFLGALSCLVDLPDDRLAASAARGRIHLPDLRSDADAVYRDRISLDLSTLGPVVVAPPSPADTRDLAEFEGRPVQVGYLGSCASGRIEDLEGGGEAARRPADRAGLSAQHRADQQCGDGSGRTRRADRDTGRGRGLHQRRHLRLLLWPHRHHGAGADGGFHRHAQRARPDG